MKKVLLVFAMLVFSAGMFVSCTPDAVNDDTELATDPNEECPPNDRNCNGIPDDQEGGN